MIRLVQCHAGALTLLCAAAAPVPPALAASPGRMTGALISDVTCDKVAYAPGTTANCSVWLLNSTGRSFSGTVSLSVWNGHGVQVGSTQTQSVTGLANGVNSSLAYSIRLPSLNWRGYLLNISASNTVPAVVDTASGAIDVSTDWAKFPRYGWVTNLTASASANSTIGMLSAYGLNAYQFYDISWKHHMPVRKTPCWQNLSNTTTCDATIQSFISAIHALGGKAFLYQLWNGAYPNFTTDGSGVQLSWGLFSSNCRATTAGCGLINLNATPANSVFMELFCQNNPSATGYGQTCNGTTESNVFPSGWAARSILEMAPTNGSWSDYIIKATTRVLKRDPFDGIQWDTLGDPTAGGTVPQYDFFGHQIDIGAALVPFVNASRTDQGAKKAVINNVSGWRESDIALHARTEIMYEEIHPEFGDTPYYPSLNGKTAAIRQSTSRPAVIADYMERQKALSQGCHTLGGPVTCYFSDPGIQYIDSQMMASGLDHFELGDLNPACPQPQPKMASNIYLPGPMLCMDGPLAEWEVDAHNFEIAYEDMLRYGTADTRESASIVSGATGSAVGAPAAVYLMPKTRPGMQILHLLNYSQVPTNYNADLNGTQPAPTTLTNIVVKMYYCCAVVNPGTNRLMWASPDYQHGLAHQITSYSGGSDTGGNYIQFTLPSLTYWDMVWLETQDLSGTTDYSVKALAQLRGSWYADATPGVGSFNAIAHLCCGQYYRLEGVDFGSGFTAVSANASAPHQTTLDIILDNPTNAPVATLRIPAGSGFSTVNGTILRTTGVHDVYVRTSNRLLRVDYITF
jgi:dextranase